MSASDKQKGRRQPSPAQKRPEHAAARIVLIYAAFSASWLFLGEALFFDAVGVDRQVALFNLAKGLLFVLATSGLLYFLLRRYLTALPPQESESRPRKEDPSQSTTGNRSVDWGWNTVTREVRHDQVFAGKLDYSFDDAQLHNRHWADWSHPEHSERTWPAINAILGQLAAEPELTDSSAFRSGPAQRILEHAHCVRRDAEGNHLRSDDSHADGDRVKEIEEALINSEKRFRGIFENAAVGIAYVAPDRTFQLVNDTFCRITGYSRDELLNNKHSCSQITYPGDLEPETLMLNKLVSGLVDNFDIEKRFIRKDGAVVWVHLSASLLRDAHDQPTSLIGAVQEITDLKNLQQELQRQAHTDYLTSLPNRRYFMELAQHEIARVQRYANPLAVIMIDIDYFKTVNDVHGHKAGDLVLQKTAQTMRETLREVDVIGRIGGEEFAILLPQTDKKRALEVAERLQTTVASTAIQIEGDLTLRVTISLGVAILTGEQANIERLLNKADRGLYAAKSLGRNQIVLSN